MDSKYLMKFAVSENLIYLSHLEIMKLIRQGFNRSEIKISYSEGFNPHMKLSLGVAKGVGLKSNCEICEFYTVVDYETLELKNKMDDNFPKGFEVKKIIKDYGKIKLPARIKEASYLITSLEEIEESKLRDFIDSKEIIQDCKSKKGIVAKDIKTLINSIEYIDSHSFMVKLKTGSSGNLRIENFLDSVSNSCDFKITKVVREEFFDDNGTII